MPYNYLAERDNVFREENQRMFLSIRDRAQRLLKQGGAVRCGELIAGETGNSWHMLACVDRLVEIKELEEIHYGDCAGQHRIFIAPYNRG